MSKVFIDVAIKGSKAGRMTFKLFKDVPKTAENFRSLCAGDSGKRHNNYDLHFKNTPFHRVITGFVVVSFYTKPSFHCTPLCVDFNNKNGTGGASIYGPKFGDENFIHSHTKRGLLSMANAGRNTNGSQFFITFAATPWLDGKHVVFGEIEEGLDVLKKIEAEGSQSGATKSPVTIEDCGELKEQA